MYYIINAETRELIRESPDPFNVDETVQPDYPLIQLKGVYNETRPALNPATQKYQRTFVDDDTAFTRTFSYIVVPKTTQEQTEYQQQVDDEAQRQQLKTVYTALRDGTGTFAERLVRVEKATAWLLRNSVRD